MCKKVYGQKGLVTRRSGLLQQSHDQGDDGQNDEDMNEAAENMKSQPASEPEDEKNDSDGIEHILIGNRFLRLRGRCSFSFVVVMQLGVFRSRCSVHGDDRCAGRIHTTVVAITRRLVLIFGCRDVVVFVPTFRR